MHPRRQPHSPVLVPAGDEVFRILCTASQVAAVKGNFRDVLKEIEQSTDSKILVEKVPFDSPDGIIRVIGNPGRTSTVKLRGNNASYEKEEVEIQVKVSKAQDALIRVFQVLNVELGTRTVSCRLLADARALLIEFADMVEMIRKNTGAKIEIRTNILPICADPDEAMVEIEGNVLAVKRALVSISSLLQSRSLQASLRRPLDDNIIIQQALPHNYGLTTDSMFHLGTSLRSSDAHRQTEAVSHDALPRTSDVSRQPRDVRPCDSLHSIFDSFPPPPDAYQRRIQAIEQEAFSQPRIDTHPDSIIASASKNHPVTAMKLVLKILCSTEFSGGVIGQRGSIIKTICSKTGASIHVGNTHADCDECLIVISASESEGRNSPTQKAIVLVFSRIHEIATKDTLDSCSSSSITARLVVPANQIGCFLEKGGCVVSQMRRQTGASIQVLEVEQNPKCVAEHDRVVEISGEFRNVKEAIYEVTGRLRTNIFSHSLTNSATKSNATFIPESTSRGFHPSLHRSLTESASPHRRSEDSFRRGSHYSVDKLDSLIRQSSLRQEDPFPNRSSSYGSADDIDALLRRYLPRQEDPLPNRSSSYGSADEIDALVRRSLSRQDPFPNRPSSHGSADEIDPFLRLSLSSQEDPFSNRFSSTDGRQSTMDSSLSTLLWGSPAPAGPRVYDGSGGLFSTMSDLGCADTNLLLGQTARVPEIFVRYVRDEDGHPCIQITGARVHVLDETLLGTMDLDHCNIRDT